MIKTSNTLEGFIEECCKDKEILACKTSKEVFDVINTCLQKTYKDKKSKESIALQTKIIISTIAEDIVESVCLKLNVDWIGI